MFGKYRRQYSLCDMPKKPIEGPKLSVEQQAQNMIINTKKQLDNMIEVFSNKISKLLQTNQSSLLIAYKKHMEEVSKQLVKLKMENNQISEKFYGDKEIIKMGKQCVIWREEAIKMHQQLQDAWCEMDNYKRKIGLLQGELVKTNESLLKMMSLKRKLQKQNTNLQQQLKQQSQIILQLKKKNEVETENEIMVTKMQTPQNCKSLGRKTKKQIKQLAKNELQANAPSTSRTINLIDPNQTTPAPFNISPISPPHNNNDQLSILSPRSSNKLSTYQIFYPQSNFITSIQNNNNNQNKTQNFNKIKSKNKTCYNLSKQLCKSDLLNHHHQKNFKCLSQHEKKQFFQHQWDRRDQLFCFKCLMYFVRKNNQKIYIEQSNDQLQSKTVSQLISNEKQMIKLCQKLFPNLLINGKEAIIKANDREKQSKKIQINPMTYLSSDLMKKLINNNEIDKITQQDITQQNEKKKNNNYFYCQRLDGINNKINSCRSKIITISDDDKKQKQKFNRMRKVYKKIYVGNRINHNYLSSFHLDGKKK